MVYEKQEGLARINVPRRWWIDFTIGYVDFTIGYEKKYKAYVSELACRRSAAAGNPNGVAQLAAYEQYVVDRRILGEPP